LDIKVPTAVPSILEPGNSSNLMNNNNRDLDLNSSRKYFVSTSQSLSNEGGGLLG
jgi:hypothetical protein